MIDLREVADATVARARELFPDAIPKTLKIDYKLEDLPGGRMGTCSRVRAKQIYVVKLNPFLMLRGGPDECRELVVHEVCHALDDLIVGGWGHANGWRMLMKLMGYVEAEPCHTVSTVGLRSKKAKFMGICNACKFEHALTMTQHDRMLRGLKTPNAKCARCGGNSFRPLSGVNDHGIVGD